MRFAAPTAARPGHRRWRKRVSCSKRTAISNTYYLLQAGYQKDNSDESYDEARELHEAVEQEYIDNYEKESDQIFPE